MKSPMMVSWRTNDAQLIKIKYQDAVTIIPTIGKHFHYSEAKCRLKVMLGFEWGHSEHGAGLENWLADATLRRKWRRRHVPRTPGSELAASNYQCQLLLSKWHQAQSTKIVLLNPNTCLEINITVQHDKWRRVALVLGEPGYDENFEI